MLPTDHFHVIFTLPSELHELWQWNRQLMTEVLFRSVRETLLTLLGDPKWLGAQPGVLATVHTWGRTLALHPHVHCLVSGGGLTVDGQRRAVQTGFLLPVTVVRALFRGKVLGAIEALWTTGHLQVPLSLGDDGVRRVLVAAARQQWNIRIAERYPHGRGVMKYLARYVRGGPIKDHRFVAFDGSHVIFRYGNHRDLDAHGKPRQAELALTRDEFLRRWSEHVPLPGVHMVRAWGLYASTQRPKLTQCREHLPGADTTRETPRGVEAEPPVTVTTPGSSVRCASSPWSSRKCCHEPERHLHGSHGQKRPEGKVQIPIADGRWPYVQPAIGADPCTERSDHGYQDEFRLARGRSTA